MLVTAEQVKSAMIKQGLERVDHHRCGICNSMVFYSREGEQLYFNSGCGCSWSAPEPREWESASDWINMQSSSEHRDALKVKFGLLADG